jgi:hypothetical protein
VEDSGLPAKRIHAVKGDKKRPPETESPQRYPRDGHSFSTIYANKKEVTAKWCHCFQEGKASIYIRSRTFPKAHCNGCIGLIAGLTECQYCQAACGNESLKTDRELNLCDFSCFGQASKVVPFVRLWFAVDEVAGK